MWKVKVENFKANHFVRPRQPPTVRGMRPLMTIDPPVVSFPCSEPEEGSAVSADPRPECQWSIGQDGETEDSTGSSDAKQSIESRNFPRCLKRSCWVVHEVNGEDEEGRKEGQLGQRN